MGIAELRTISEPAGSRTAIVFIHGFGGDAKSTWGKFPEYLRGTRALSDWSIYSLGYASGLSPNWLGLWAADPGIETLATYLHTQATLEPLKSRRLALIAHSMGGLVVQKALVDYPDLARRVTHVLLYGTPSGGLEKASGIYGRLFKRPVADMGLERSFIPDLRLAWRERFGDGAKPLTHPSGRPFGFWAVAGDRDDFVPASSSIGPFAKDDCAVVPGNHLRMVKPRKSVAMGVQVAIDAIVGDAAPGGPWNAARVAVELGEFRDAIKALEPHVDDLDEPNAVLLALALEAMNRRDAAIDVLKKRCKKKGSTDGMGTLAGRFKRVWWSQGTETPAREALGLYREGYRLAEASKDHDQAFYHGINIAFMEFAFSRNSVAAQEMAEEVLDHCREAQPRDFWCQATIGEAHLYLGQTSEALEGYRQAVAMNPEPWQMKSMFGQALHVADALDDSGLSRTLDEIFRLGPGD